MEVKENFYIYDCTSDNEAIEGISVGTVKTT